MPLVGEIEQRLRAAIDDPDGTGQEAAAVARFQALVAPVGSYQPPLVDVGERTIPGPHGGIPLRVYRPRAKGSGIGLIWLHGGGFTSGDLDMPESDTVARELCQRAAATIIAVDYRLARDGVHFPVPHDDVLAAWRWVVEACSELGIEAHRVSIGGCSAGGNLAAGAALALRDQHLRQPQRLVLAYPVLHAELPAARDPLPADMTLLPDALRYMPETYRAAVRSYIGDGARPTPYAFPALADLRGMPATIVLTCEYDDLRTSGEEFAAALADAGVRVVLRREPGVPHGYLNIAGLQAFEDSLRRITAALTEEAVPEATGEGATVHEHNVNR